MVYAVTTRTTLAVEFETGTTSGEVKTALMGSQFFKSEFARLVAAMSSAFTRADVVITDITVVESGNSTLRVLLGASKLRGLSAITDFDVSVDWEVPNIASQNDHAPIFSDVDSIATTPSKLTKLATHLFPGIQTATQLTVTAVVATQTTPVTETTYVDNENDVVKFVKKLGAKKLSHGENIAIIVAVFVIMGGLTWAVLKCNKKTPEKEPEFTEI